MSTFDNYIQFCPWPVPCRMVILILSVISSLQSGDPDIVCDLFSGDPAIFCDLFITEWWSWYCLWSLHYRVVILIFSVISSLQSGDLDIVCDLFITEWWSWYFLWSLHYRVVILIFSVISSLQSGDPIIVIYNTSSEGNGTLGMLGLPAASASSESCLNTNPAGKSSFLDLLISLVTAVGNYR